MAILPRPRVAGALAPVLWAVVLTASMLPALAASGSALRAVETAGPDAASAPASVAQNVAPRPADPGNLGPSDAAVFDPDNSLPANVLQTDVLTNGTVVPGAYFAADALHPLYVTYDPADGLIYVVTLYGVVVAIDPATEAVVGGLSLSFTTATGAAFDPTNGYLYLAEETGPAELAALNVTTWTVAAVVHLSAAPFGLAYDPSTGDMIVGLSVRNSLAIVDPVNESQVGTIPIGAEPRGVEYDSVTNDLYTENFLSDNLTVVNGTTYQITGAIALGQAPLSATVDPNDGFLYVPDFSSGATSNVSVVNASAGAVVATIALSQPADLAAYDPLDNDVYVSSGFSVQDNLTVLDAASQSVVGLVVVGNGPEGLGFDPGTGQLFVANYASNNVSVVNGTTGLVAGSVRVGVAPTVVVLDPATQELYIGGQGLPQLLVWSLSAQTIVGTVALGYPATAIAYDSLNGELFVTEALGSVAVIDAAENTVVDTISLGSTTAQPAAIAFDPSNGYLYVENDTPSPTYTNWVTVINGANDSIVTSIAVGAYPDSIAYDPVDGDLYVANEFSPNISIIDPSTETDVGAVALPVPAGVGASSTVFDPSDGDVWVWANATLFAIDPGTRTIAQGQYLGIGFGSLTVDSLNGELVAISQLVTVVEVFATAPTAPQWSVGTLQLHSGAESVVVDPANGYLYVGDTELGSISVLQPTYVLSLTESGLSSKELRTKGWDLVLDGDEIPSGSDELNVTLTNGSYAYALLGPSGKNVSGIAPSGAFQIVNGAIVAAFQFAPGRTVAFSFTESGLAKGQSWCVEVASLQRCSTTAAIHYPDLTPGDYAYAFVSPRAGQSVVATEDRTTVAVNGTLELLRGATVHYRVLYDYSVTFTETGLATPSWAVALNGFVCSPSDSAVCVLPAPNGSFAFRVLPVAGYTVHAIPHRAVVDGANIAISVVFSARR